MATQLRSPFGFDLFFSNAFTGSNNEFIYTRQNFWKIFSKVSNFLLEIVTECRRIAFWCFGMSMRHVVGSHEYHPKTSKYRNDNYAEVLSIWTNSCQRILYGRMNFGGITWEWKICLWNTDAPVAYRLHELYTSLNSPIDRLSKRTKWNGPNISRYTVCQSHCDFRGRRLLQGEDPDLNLASQVQDHCTILPPTPVTTLQV